ncbi:hypothetical protein KY284_012877 [Solanum tuberosum]|nr:hypothetical protein KY284_012877 [Solanum tuberosum]
MPIHLLAAMQPPIGVMNQIERMLNKFFWGGTDEVKKHYWASWEKMCYPYEEGGVAFRRIHDICVAFTVKQWWNLRARESLWGDFILAKYCQRIHPVKKNGTQGTLILGMQCAKQNPRNDNLSEILLNGHWQWGGWDLYLPDHVMNHINFMQINLNPNVKDKAIWTPDEKGNFTISSTWNIMRQKRDKSWINAMNWNNKVPFKMNFILWRALRDKIPTDSNLMRMGINAPSRNLWTWKTRNPVLALIVKYLPIVATWELWKTRCGAKYGKEQYSVRKCISQIVVTITQLVASQFVNVKLMPNWESIVHLKMNGSCKNDLCGGGGVIRDCEGYLLFAYSLNLGEGTSNWAEAMALLYGIRWCINNEYEFILVESDSKLLVNCVNDQNSTPWKMQKEVEELKAHMENTSYILRHCYREANKVADKLASLCHTNQHSTMFTTFAELPRRIKGLMTMDRWNMINFRTIRKKKIEIIWDPP